LPQPYDGVTAVNARDVRHDPIACVIVNDAPRIAFVCLAKFQLKVRVLCASDANTVDFVMLSVAQSPQAGSANKDLVL